MLLQKIMHDIKSCRKANVDSDHYLIIAEMKMKVIKPIVKHTRARKWNIEQLKSTKMQRSAHRNWKRILQGERIIEVKKRTSWNSN